MSTAPAPAVESVVAGLLTKEQLAEQLGCSTRTIDRFQAQGMPVIRKGRVVRLFDPQAVRAWLVDDRQPGRRSRRPAA